MDETEERHTTHDVLVVPDFLQVKYPAGPTMPPHIALIAPVSAGDHTSRRRLPSLHLDCEMTPVNVVKSELNSAEIDEAQPDEVSEDVSVGDDTPSEASSSLVDDEIAGDMDTEEIDGAEESANFTEQGSEPRKSTLFFALARYRELFASFKSLDFPDESSRDQPYPDVDDVSQSTASSSTTSLSTTLPESLLNDGWIMPSDAPSHPPDPFEAGWISTASPSPARVP